MKDNIFEHLTPPPVCKDADVCNGRYLNENAELFMCIPAIQTLRS